MSARQFTMIFALCGWLAAASAEDVSLMGAIGSHPQTFTTRKVIRTGEFNVNEPAADILAITEIYPDTPNPVEVHYRVTGPGIEPYERIHRSGGFGPVTFFVRIAHPPAGPLTITNLAAEPEKSPVFISSMRGISRASLDAIHKSDQFQIMGTIINPQIGPPNDAQFAMMRQNLHPRPEQHISVGFSGEIYYANRPEADVRQQLQTAHDRAKSAHLPALLGLVSWWAGTPLGIDDGHGGTFGDLKYQQICYTPNFEHPENEALKQFLGARYNRHYCLSVPNIWSNTPWLTMNSDIYNAYRERRLGEAIRLLKEVSDVDLSWVAGLFLENEPRYWDTQSVQGTPFEHGEQWADFNPLVIEAARRDGVTLDPADGMTDAELVWLHRNLGCYMQWTVDACRKAMAAQGISPDMPLYTHSLQLAVLFPGCKINHPASEWAYADNARTGIEGIWSMPSDFERVREWGPWCNLNREETDGLPIDTHLWDLRVAYMAGAELYNSYNWHAITKDAFFNYVARFQDKLTSVTLPPAGADPIDTTTLRLKPPQELQAFTQLSVPLEITVTTDTASTSPLSAALSVDNSEGKIFLSERLKLEPASGPRAFTFEWLNPAECNWNKQATVRLLVYDAAGGQVNAGRLHFTPDATKNISLTLDLATQRALSRQVGEWRMGRVAPQ